MIKKIQTVLSSATSVKTSWKYLAFLLLASIGYIVMVQQVDVLKSEVAAAGNSPNVLLVAQASFNFMTRFGSLFIIMVSAFRISSKTVLGSVVTTVLAVIMATKGALPTSVIFGLTAATCFYVTWMSLLKKGSPDGMN